MAWETPRVCRQGWILQLALQQQQPEPNMAPDQAGFYPERWLDDSGSLIEQPKSFMPFGGGPRLCLGWMLAKMEMKAGPCPPLPPFSFPPPPSRVLLRT